MGGVVWGNEREPHLPRGERIAGAPDTGITVTREQIGSYLSSLGNEGGTPAQYPPTERSWSCCMPLLPGGRIGRGTLRQWREQLLDQGYSPSTVNTSVSAANSFLEWLGCREFQLTGRLSCGRDAQLELTRSEYLRLLSTARALRQERVYLLIKLFTSTGLPVHELEQVTVEAAGEGSCSSRGGDAQRLPDCLRRELLDYARRRGSPPAPSLSPAPAAPAAGPGSLSASAGSAQDAQVPRKGATRGACGSCITPPERRSRPLWPSWWSRPMSACWRRNRPPSAGAAVRR